jgi:putative ABC transport system permease protein
MTTTWCAARWPPCSPWSRTSPWWPRWSAATRSSAPPAPPARTSPSWTSTCPEWTASRRRPPCNDALPGVATLILTGHGKPGHLRRALAAANLSAGARRLASVIAPLTLMIGLTATILFVQTTMGHAATRQATEGTLAAHVVGPKVPHVTAEQIRRAPGVTAVTEVVHSTVRVGLANYGVQGVTAHGLDKTMDLDVREGAIKDLGPTSIAVSTTAASRLHLAVGDTLRLTLGDGTPIAPKVIAIYGRGLGFGDLTLSHDILAAHVDDPRGTVLIAGAAPKGVPTAGAASLAEDTASANAEVNYVAMGLIIAFTAIAVVNTLAMSTAGRARELALLRLVGTTRRQIMRMLGWETLAVVLISGVLGTAIALAVLTAFGHGMTGGGPSVPPLSHLGILACAGLLAAAATALPARLAMAARPADVIGARE